ATRVGSPDVALVSVPAVFTPVPDRVTEPRPNPTSAAPILLLVVPVLVTVAFIERTYAALLLSLSGTDAVTKLFALLGPSSPRVIETANGLFTTPSVVTPPPELPLSVSAPPELISTNFETVALMPTVPVVVWPTETIAATNSKVAKPSACAITRLLRFMMISRGLLGLKCSWHVTG